MQYFSYSSTIHAPVERVFAFHERDDILKLLMPRFPPAQVLRRQGGLKVGAEVEFRIWMGPLPVRWLARHIEYEKNRLFTDIQVRGPFRHWKHQHRFESAGADTLLTDSVEYGLHGGRMAELLFGGVVRRQLQAMFRYRHQVTKRECEP